jgi:hypothetical protein
MPEVLRTDRKTRAKDPGADRELPILQANVMKQSVFAVHLCAKAGPDSIRALRTLLKIALRQFGIRATKVEELEMNYRDKLEKMKARGFYRVSDFEEGKEVVHVIDHLMQDCKMFDRTIDILNFKDTARQLQMNVTNGELLFDMFGEPDNWEGKAIALYLAPYGISGKLGIRVKAANGVTPSVPAPVKQSTDVDLDDEIPFD